MSNKTICGNISASVTFQLARQLCTGPVREANDATKQDVSLTVKLQSEPCAGSWAGLLRSDNVRDLHALQPQAWTFVQCQEMCWGFCAHSCKPSRLLFVRTIRIGIFVLAFPICLQFSAKPSSVGSQPAPRQHPQFIFVGPNVSPNCFPVNR